MSERWLVEMSAVTSSGQDLIGNDMRLFADHLKPYLVLGRKFRQSSSGCP